MVETMFPESDSRREGHLNPVLAPEGEILSFAWPKESIQRKGHPAAAKALALLACRAGTAKGQSVALCRRASSLKRPVGPFRPSSCDAQRGWTGQRQEQKNRTPEKGKLFYATPLKGAASSGKKRKLEHPDRMERLSLLLAL